MQKSPQKISVIGAGKIGVGIAQAILAQGLADELVLLDPNFDKAKGEMLDLKQAFPFIPRTKMIASNDYSATARSDLCIITIGAQQPPGEYNLNLLQSNVVIYKTIVRQLAKYSPDTILLVVLNPVEILTHVVFKLSGFDSNRVIGLGTNLDTSNFRLSIADHFGFDAENVQAFIIGERGNRSVAPWSSISVSGFPFLSFVNLQQIPYENGTLENIHKDVINSTEEVMRLKGDTCCGLGYSVADLASSILGDRRKIHPVAVLVRGFNGIEGADVFMSLPALLGRGGVLGVTNMHLTQEETQRLQESAETMLGVQRQLVL